VPQWNQTIELGDLVQQYKNQQVDISELAELVAERIKRSGWRQLTPYPDDFDGLLAQLQNVEDRQGYGAVFDEIYDLADSDRVWIETS